MCADVSDEFQHFGAHRSADPTPRLAGCESHPSRRFCSRHRTSLDECSETDRADGEPTRVDAGVDKMGQRHASISIRGGMGRKHVHRLTDSF